MTSIRPAQYAQRTRSDGGPFIQIAMLGEDGEVTAEAKLAESAYIFYSDIPLLEDAPEGWHQILRVEPDLITMWPIHPRSESTKYGLPKYGSVTEIQVAKRVCDDYSIPDSMDALEELLLSLPDGFGRDWRFGLGLLWEYRFIVEAIADIDGIETLVIHGGDAVHDARTVDGTYFLGIERYHELRTGLNRLTQRHQRETRSDKQLVCYTGLVHAAAPDQYPAKSRRLPPNMLADLISLGKGRTPLSQADQRSVTRLVRDNAEDIVKKEPNALLELKADIELVTLGELIERYKKQMAANVKEGPWQTFLAGNPFILDMAFGYPVKVVGERPYVGSKGFSGRGGQYSDFLMAAKSTGNLALIEIKHPQQELFKYPAYRNNTYGPSVTLSGSVAQIISQRASLQRQIHELSDGLDEPVHAHAVTAIVIVGRTPQEKHHIRSFEQYRNSLKDVLVVTFDELQQRLEDIYRALSVPRKSGPTAIAAEGDCPF